MFCISKLSNPCSRAVFTEGISKEVITFRDDYQQLLSSKLNKGDQAYFISQGVVNTEILKHGWTETDIVVWLESLKDQDYNAVIEIISLESPIHEQWKMFSKEFMVNHESNAFLISWLISDQLINLYSSGDIDNRYIIKIYYAPLTRTNYKFIESFFMKKDRR